MTYKRSLSTILGLLFSAPPHSGEALNQESSGVGKQLPRVVKVKNDEVTINAGFTE